MFKFREKIETRDQMKGDIKLNYLRTYSEDINLRILNSVCKTK